VGKLDMDDDFPPPLGPGTPNWLEAALNRYLAAEGTVDPTVAVAFKQGARAALAEAAHLIRSHGGSKVVINRVLDLGLEE
jgi:hypothetical protein